MTPAPTTGLTIVLEVEGGPLDGQRFEGSQELVRIGRSDGAGRDGASNDLVLQRDNYASGFHMQIYHENGSWWVRDIGSTNGSWSSAGRLEPNVPVQLQDDDYVIAGNSVIHVSHAPRNLPPVDPNAMNMFSPAAQTVLIRARKLAREQKVAWLGAALTFNVLSETDQPQLAEFFGQAGLDPQQAALTVRQWSRWKGALAWIEKDEQIARSQARAKLASALPTPRLQSIATLADRARQRWGANQIEPIHLLHAILEEGRNRVTFALAEAGFSRDVLMQLIADMLTATQAKAEPTGERERTMAIAPAAAIPAVPKRKPVDAETWLLARGMMDKIQQRQAEYQLAEPGVRFDALCSDIREGVQRCNPAKREGLIETLYYLFPVLEEALVKPPPALAQLSAVKSGEQTDGERDPDTAGGNVTIMDEDSPPSAADHRRPHDDDGMDTGELLQKVFGAERMATMAGQPAEENQILALMKHLYNFALDMERLAKGMVQSLQGGGAGESRYFLPFTAHDLKMMSERLVEDGNPESVRQLRMYLDDLGRWIIALIAAHQKAANEWNREVWAKINPNAIKDEAKMGALNKALGGTAELWRTYERLSRDLDPDVTDDILTQRIGRMANDEFRRLTSR